MCRIWENSFKPSTISLYLKANLRLTHGNDKYFKLLLGMHSKKHLFTINISVTDNVQLVNLQVSELVIKIIKSLNIIEFLI